MKTQLTPQKRLTDPTLKSLQQRSRSAEEEVPDGSVPGLSVRLFPGGAANWALIVRVKGEGGVNRHGKALFTMLGLFGELERAMLAALISGRGTDGRGERI